MSLLTDALRLREGRQASRVGSGPSFPPFRGPQPGRWIIGVLVVCVLGVLGWWKGEWMIERVEELAGLAPPKAAPNLLALGPREATPPAAEIVPREEPARKREPLASSAKAEEKGGVTPTADGARRGGLEESIPKTNVSAAGASSQNPAAELISPEAKKQGELLLTDSLVKTVAEKPPVGEGPKVPEEETPAAVVPSGGLQPMKVELVEMDLMVETPEEREKKRTEAVEEFLRVLKVQGVRLQGADSRILVDGAPIGLGEKVGSLGLVLEGVEPQKIIFSDASGKKYPKSY